ncbi:MAG: ribokinase [Pikeienuella sp.]
MAIHCFGSVNIDHVHQVRHFPRAGETLADLGYARHLGGKGLNQAIAARRAGAQVHMTGAVGADGRWIADRLAAEGIDVANLAVLDAPTGHAVIYVTPDGENSIVIHAGANRAMDLDLIDRALAAARPGDWWLVQNETAHVLDSAARARQAGLRVAFAAAPFDPLLAQDMLAVVDLLALNEGEARDLGCAMGAEPEHWPTPAVLITLGARGARLLAVDGWPARPMGTGPKTAFECSAHPVQARDTTGAGDCFLGCFLASLDQGLAGPAALDRASLAAAISVTRAGAADAMPTAAEIAGGLP